MIIASATVKNGETFFATRGRAAVRKVHGAQSTSLRIVDVHAHLHCTASVVRQITRNLHQVNVIVGIPTKTDIIVAFNFSYYILKTRAAAFEQRASTSRSSQPRALRSMYSGMKRQ